MKIHWSSEIQFSFKLWYLVVSFHYLLDFLFSVCVQVMDWLLWNWINTYWGVLVQIFNHSRINSSTFNDLFLVLFDPLPKISGQKGESQNSKSYKNCIKTKSSSFNLSHDWVFLQLSTKLFHFLLIFLE